MHNREVYFRHFTEALAYFRYKNPARQKSVNLLETSHGSRTHYDAFDPRCPDRIWSAITKGLSELGEWIDKRKYDCFLSFHVARSADVQTLKKRHSVSHMTIHRWLEDAVQTFCQILVQKGLLDAEDIEERKYTNARKRYDSPEEKAKREKRDEEKRRAIRGQHGGKDDRVVYRD